MLSNIADRKLKNLVANFFKLINLHKVSQPMKKAERLSEKKKTSGRKAEKEQRSHFEVCKHFFTVLTLFS